MLQECDVKVRDVLFDRDGLQGRLSTKASKPSGIRNSLMATHERLEQHLGRLTAICLRLESFLSSSVFSFINGVSALKTTRLLVIE